MKICLSLLLLISCLAWSQETRGTLLGRVSDQAAAVVPNVEVRATNTATGVIATAKSNAAGNYTLPYLLPGTYTLDRRNLPASRSSFVKVSRSASTTRSRSTSN